MANPSEEKTEKMAEKISKEKIEEKAKKKEEVKDEKESKEKTEKETKAISEEAEIVAPCGIYCGACAIYKGEIKETAVRLGDIVTAYGFRESSRFIPELEVYPQFIHVLTWFAGLTCVGCRAGGGNPNCFVRQCCAEKKIETCSQCGGFPCLQLNDLQRTRPGIIENLNEIKEKGVENWAKEQKKKVEDGFSYADALIDKFKR